MDGSIVEKIKFMSLVVVCVTAFLCILVIAQLDNAFDLQPEPESYSVQYLFIKTRPVIFSSEIKCTTTSSSHPVTDDNIIKLDQLVNCWEFTVTAAGS